MEAPKPAQEASETGSSTSETSSPSSEGSQVSVEEEFEELDMDALRIDESDKLYWQVEYQKILVKLVDSLREAKEYKKSQAWEAVKAYKLQAKYCYSMTLYSKDSLQEVRDMVEDGLPTPEQFKAEKAAQMEAQGAAQIEAEGAAETEPANKKRKLDNVSA